MVDTDNGDGPPAISPVLSRSQGSGGLSAYQQRNLLATPPCGPLNRLPSEQKAKETEEYESAQESPVSHADTRSVELVRLNEESGNDDSRLSADDSLDQKTSQSLVPHSQHTDPDSSIAESSQSIIPHPEEQGLRLTEIHPEEGDEVEVHMQQRRDGRLFTSVRRVRHVDPEQSAETITAPYGFI